MRTTRNLALATALAAALLAAPTAQARDTTAWSSTCGHLYPGKIVYTDACDLPPGWRAYPLSIFQDIYEIRPVRTRARTNFTTRHRKPPRPQRLRK